MIASSGDWWPLSPAYIAGIVGRIDQSVFRGGSSVVLQPAGRGFAIGKAARFAARAGRSVFAAIADGGDDACRGGDRIARMFAADARRYGEIERGFEHLVLHPFT